MSEHSGTHPAWCSGGHSLDGAHASTPVVIEPDGAGLARTVLYLWRPQGSSVMVAAELRAAGDEEPMLYLFSAEGMAELRKALGDLGRLVGEVGGRSKAAPSLGAYAPVLQLRQR